MHRSSLLGGHTSDLLPPTGFRSLPSPRGGRLASSQAPFRHAASTLVTGRHVPVGASASSPPPSNLSSQSLIPRRKNDYESVLIHSFSKKQPKDCAICLQPLLAFTEAAKMRCAESHIFHQDCLKEWLQRNPSCPLCRTTAREPPSTREHLEAAMAVLDQDAELEEELTRLNREMEEELADARRGFPTSAHSPLSPALLEIDSELELEMARINREMEVGLAQVRHRLARSRS